MIKYQAKFATTAEKETHEHQLQIADIRGRFGELKQCPIHENAML